MPRDNRHKTQVIRTEPLPFALVDMSKVQRASEQHFGLNKTERFRTHQQQKNPTDPFLPILLFQLQVWPQRRPAKGLRSAV